MNYNVEDKANGKILIHYAFIIHYIFLDKIFCNDADFDVSVRFSFEIDAFLIFF